MRDDLVEVFGLAVCYRDPHVAPFGLHNSLLPVGTSFIEIVAPTEERTAAGRYLDRRGGDGGYMTILNSDEINSWRTHISAIGVREATFLDYDGFNAIQMHPRDTGGSILEINRSPGGEDLLGNYVPAGPDWQHYRRTSRVRGIVGAELQGDNPEELARRWAAILKRKVSKASNAEWHLAVDNATIRFVPARDGRGEGLGGIDVEVLDPGAINRVALDRGLSVEGNTVAIGGVRFNLVAERAITHR